MKNLSVSTVNLLKAFLIIALASFSQLSAANTRADIAYHAAKTPGIESVTKGYNLLEGSIAHSVPLIKGALPFTLNYNANLRALGGGTLLYYTSKAEMGVPDIDSNYSGFFLNGTLKPKDSTKVYNNVYIFRLPGSNTVYFFAKLPSGSLSRIYTTGGTASLGSHFESPITREVTMTQMGTSFVIRKDGVVYTTNAAVPYILDTNPAQQEGSFTLSRFGSISYPSGTRLTLSYDVNQYLMTVNDNRNNSLVFQRNYKSAFSAQTIAQKALITGVTYTSGNDTQTATIQYQEQQIDNPLVINQKVTLHSMIGVNSPAFGQYTFQYTNVFRPSIYKANADMNYRAILNDHVASSALVAPPKDSWLPTLSSVTDAANNKQRVWAVTNLDLGYYDIIKKQYLVHRYTLNSHRPTLAGNIESYTSAYDDIAGTITTSFSPDGVQNSQATVTITPPNIPWNYDPKNLAQMDAYTSTVTVSGSFQCLTDSQGLPISSVQTNSYSGRVYKLTDARGYVSDYKYDALSRLTKVTEAVGTPQQRITDYTYTTLSTGAVNDMSVPNTIVAPSLTVTNILNARGQITSQTKSYPSSAASTPQTWLFYYHEDATLPNFGLLNYTTGPSFTGGVNDMQSWVYDIYGNVASHDRYVNNSSNAPVIRRTSYANYNSAGLPLVVNYPDATKDTLTYNAGYRLLSKIRSGSALSQTTTNTYDTLNRMISAADADGYVTTYAYDAIGRPSIVTEPNGNTTNTTYFPNSSVSAVTQKDSLGQIAVSTLNTLDVNGRLYTTSPNAANRLRSTMTYDANGNVTKTVSSLGIIDAWTYDPLNRVISHTDGNGKVDTKAYDAADNNVTETAANNAGSARGFIQRDVLKQENNTDFGLKTYTYDKGNRLIAKSHVGRSCDFGVVDQDNRQHLMNCNDRYDFSMSPNLGINDTYTYDTSTYGNLDKVTGERVATNYTYDEFHRVLRKTQANLAPQTYGYNAYSPSQQVINYSYTPAGRMTSMTYPSGKIVNYTYDNNGVLKWIDVNGQAIAGSIYYDGANRVRGWNFGGVGNYYINYDFHGLVHTTHYGDWRNWFHEFYVYDVDGRSIGKLLDSQVGGDANSYTYDNNSQLLTETLPNTSKVTYTYDTNGNRRTLTTTGATGLPYTSAGYGYIGNLLNAWSKNGVAQTLGLSVHGELYNTYKGITVHDYAGRRKQEFGDFSGITGRTGQTFEYNHKNERTFRRGSNLDRQYAYDESSHLIGEYTGGGALVVEYIWLGDRPIAAVYPNNRIVYLVTDYQNKPRRGIDPATQQVVWSWDPDAFGVLQPAAGLPNGVEINLRFPGQYYDVDSGLYYNHNRYYNPELGRYMEPDPIGLEGGLNPYAYAGNDPVNKVDPTGLYVTSWLGGMFVESFNWATTGQFNWAGVNGALYDGYNSGTFSGIASSAASDLLNFGMPFAGKLAGPVTSGFAGLAKAIPTTAASTVVRPWKELARTSEGQAVNKAMSQFGSGPNGANTLLRNVQAGEVGVPSSASSEALLSYRGAVQKNYNDLIRSGRSETNPNFGVMETRLKIYDIWLKGKK